MTATLDPDPTSADGATPDDNGALDAAEEVTHYERSPVDVLRFLGEPGGEFMAVVPVGHPSRVGTGPKKHPLEMKVKSFR